MNLESCHGVANLRDGASLRSSGFRVVVRLGVGARRVGYGERDPIGCTGEALSPSELIETVTQWARLDDRVIAFGLCGSYARGNPGPDSDIDFIVLCQEPKSLLEDRSWIQGFGSEARVAGPVEDYNLVQSFRVFYGTTEAEFGVTDQAWAQLPLDQETARVIHDGLKILYDPERRLADAAAFAAKMFP